MVHLKFHRNLTCRYSGRYGSASMEGPTLAIGLENGTRLKKSSNISGNVLIYQSINDEAPVLIETKLSDVKLRWNDEGTILGISGSTASLGNQSITRFNSIGNKTSSKLLLFSNSGKLLYTWGLPISQDIKSMSWQAGSLALALAIDTNLILCIARTNAKYSRLKWTYLDESSTLIFSQAKSCSSNNWITYWNLDSKQIHTRYSI